MYVNGQELRTELLKYLQMSKISISDPFGSASKEIKFEPQLIGTRYAVQVL